MRTWLRVQGEYINLAVATSIVELDYKAGVTGFTIRQDSYTTTIKVPNEIASANPDTWSEHDRHLMRAIVKIRNFVYDHEIRDTA